MDVLTLAMEAYTIKAYTAVRQNMWHVFPFQKNAIIYQQPPFMEKLRLSMKGGVSMRTEILPPREIGLPTR